MCLNLCPVHRTPSVHVSVVMATTIALSLECWLMVIHSFQQLCRHAGDVDPVAPAAEQERVPCFLTDTEIVD